MPLSLSLAPIASPMTTHESARVRVELHSTESRERVLPGTADTTFALTLRAYTLLGECVWEGSQRTRHIMMIANRPDWTGPALETLAPGETWTWEIDLARFHYPFRAGDLEIEASYTYAPEGVELKSERQMVMVLEPAIVEVSFGRDDCVLDGLHALVRTHDEHGDAWYLRLHNAGHPLAAWYSSRLPVEPSTQHVLYAFNGFHREDTFDHFFERWFIAIEPDRVRARQLVHGRWTGQERTAPRLEPTLQPRTAFWDGREGLFLLSTRDDEVHCHRFTSTGLAPVFVHRGLRADEIVVDRAHVHLVEHKRRLRYQRLEQNGTLVAERELPSSRLAPWACRYDPDRRHVLAIYWNGAGDRSIRLVMLQVESGKLDELTRTFLLHAPITELSFDYDSKARFHLLLGTRARSLYYARGDSSLWRVATGEDCFFPRVCATNGTFLGFTQSGHGFRFRQFAAQAQKGHLLPPDR